MELFPKDKDNFEWDCYIISVNELKNEILMNQEIPLYPEDRRNKLLMGYFPRFIWRATLLINKIPTLALLADATGARNNTPFIFLYCFDDEVYQNVKNSFMNYPEDSEYFSKQFLEDFKEIV